MSTEQDKLPRLGGPSEETLMLARELMKMFKEGNLEELDVTRGSLRVRLRRGGATEARTDGPDVRGAKSSSAVNSSVEETRILMPMHGIFYRSETFEGPRLVDVGAHVKEGDALCVVEAMKVFTAITAPHAGIITAIMADDASILAGGELLMTIAPA